jgi:hypothetical protein
MSFLGNLFTDEVKTTTDQSQQSTTQNNLWNDPRLQGFLSQYAQQYGNAGQFNVPQSQFTLGAAQNQTGVAPGLSTTYAGFGDIARSGLDPAMIQRYMNPEVDNVVGATQRDFNVQNDRTNQQVGSSLGKSGALWNTNAGNERAVAREGMERVQAPVIAGLRSAAYNNATQSAIQDVAMRNSALQGQVGTANAMTGANVAGGNLGNQEFMQRYQNARSPYELTSAGVQGWGGLGGLAGQNSQGTSHGTSLQQTTPSTGSIVSGIAGSLLSGSPSNFFSNLGSFMIPGVPGGANGGAIAGRESGGRVGLSTGGPAPIADSLHDKVKTAFRTLQGLRDEATERAKGGKVEGFEGGGVTPLESERAATGAGSTQIPASERGGGYERRAILDRYMDPRPAEDTSGWFSHGAWAGRPTTPMQNLGFALTQVGERNPFKGFGEYGKSMAQNRIQEIQLQRTLEQLENERTRLGMAQEKLPYELEQIEANTDLARMNADREYQQDLKLQEAARARDQEALKDYRKTENEVDWMVDRGVMTPAEGENRKAMARQLYQRTRGDIESARSAPKAIPQVLPPGSESTWTPGAGVQ